jgi:hypothetical protein
LFVRDVVVPGELTVRMRPLDDCLHRAGLGRVGDRLDDARRAAFRSGAEALDRVAALGEWDRDREAHRARGSADSGRVRAAAAWGSRLFGGRG